MSAIVSSEVVQGVFQQREADGCEVLRFNGNQHVTRSVISGLGEDGFRRCAVDNDQVTILEFIRDKGGKDLSVRLDRLD